MVYKLLKLFKFLGAIFKQFSSSSALYHLAANLEQDAAFSLVLMLCPDDPLMYWGMQARERQHLNKQYIIITITVNIRRPEGKNINRMTRK
jgi:hypothetical protein